MLKLKNKKINDCCRELQYLGKLFKWDQLWKVRSDAKKCHVLGMGGKLKETIWKYRMRNEQTGKINEERNLG